MLARPWPVTGTEAHLDVWSDGPHGVGHFGPHAVTPLGLACRALNFRRIDEHLVLLENVPALNDFSF